MKLSDLGIQDEVFEKLLDVCDQMNIKVALTPFAPSGACFDPINNIISIAPAVLFNCKDAIPTMAHELGHAATLTRGDLFATMLVNTTGGMIIKSLPEFGTVVYEQEKKAWNAGQSLLELIGYKDWDCFNSVKQKALSSYEILLPKPEVK